MSGADGRARPVGINHVALEVGDVEEAVAWLGRIFEVRLRGRAPGMAFVDLGDQFLALAEGGGARPDEERHFGFVVDDVDVVRAALAREGVEEVPTRFADSVDFRDPWGNRWQCVGYRDVQFERTQSVRRALGIEDLQKTEEARRQLAERGLL